MCAYQGDPFPSQTFEVATVAELESAAADMLAVQKALRDNNRDAVLKGVHGKFVILSYAGMLLRVNVSKQPKHTNVTDTSKEAYRSIDFTTQSGKVAECILGETLRGRDITRAEIAHQMNEEKSSVCGRVKELLLISEFGGIEINGVGFRLVLTAPRLSRCTGASGQKNEAMRFERVLPENNQTKLF